MDWNNPRQVEQALGAPLNSPVRPRNFAYLYPFAFTSAIAAGATSSVQVKTLSSGAFVLNTVSGTIRDSAGAVRLDRDNNSPPLFLRFTSNDGVWQQEEVEWASFVGTAEQPYFPLFRPVVPAGATLTLSIRNAHSAAVRPFLLLAGHVLGVA